MNKHKTMTLRIDEARAGDLARLLGHVGGGTKSKAIWRGYREDPGVAERGRGADGRASDLAGLRAWADEAADFMRDIAEGERAFFTFPSAGSDDIKKLRSLVTARDVLAWG